MMIRSAFLVVAAVLVAGAVAAQSDPIAARKALMKANGDQAKIGVAMAKGEAPFDAQKAKVMFATFLDAANKMPNLFPDNSRTGGETAASPKIWENLADVKARFAKLASDAKAAQASVTDLESFKATFGSIGKQDCGGCHELYRIKKSRPSAPTRSLDRERAYRPRVKRGRCRRSAPLVAPRAGRGTKGFQIG